MVLNNSKWLTDVVRKAYYVILRAYRHERIRKRGRQVSVGLDVRIAIAELCILLNTRQGPKE